jgi:predicted CXXCH cytochrome family protein
MRRFVSLVLSGTLGTQLLYAGAHPVSRRRAFRIALSAALTTTGDYVHPAVKSGCISCHKIENREAAIYVTVQPKESDGCRTCHPSSPTQHPHFPYASGTCTRCQDPHTSRYPRLLRAKVNDVCLDCHLQGRARTDSRYLPTIELSSDYRVGHPYARHQVRGTPDPISGEEMSC